MPILLDLFLTFLKIGAVSFGGGYAMIPLVKDEVLSHGWMSEKQIINFIAVSESTPGPIAINMATFVGVSQAGFWGALLASFAVVLPAFVIILIVASIIKGLLHFAGVKAFLSGVRLVVIGLIISTSVSLLFTVLLGMNVIGQKVQFDYKVPIILTLIASFYFGYKKIKGKNVSAIILILFSAVLGIIFYGLL